MSQNTTINELGNGSPVSRLVLRITDLIFRMSAWSSNPIGSGKSIIAPKISSVGPEGLSPLVGLRVRWVDKLIHQNTCLVT